MLHRFMARQLARPSGLFGRWVTSRRLDKRNLLMNQVTLDRLALNASDKVLEVGFGGGYLLEQILSSKPCSYAAGVDLSAEMVRLVGRRLRKYIRSDRAHVREGSIEALPYESEAFTKLCSVNTIYFWPDPIVALAECRRVLKKEGSLVLCFNAKNELERWVGHKYGFRLYELSEVESLLYESGFGSIDVVSAKDAGQGLFYCVSARVVG